MPPHAAEHLLLSIASLRVHPKPTAGCGQVQWVGWLAFRKPPVRPSLNQCGESCLSFGSRMSPIISADFTHPYGVLPQRLEDGEERDRYLLGHQVQTARQHINPAILLGIGGRGWSDHQHGSDAGRGAQDLARVLNTSRFGDTDPPVFEGRVIDAKREDDARLAVSRKPGLCFSEPPLRDIATGLAPNSQVVGGQVVAFPSGRSGDSPRPTKTLQDHSCR